MSASPAVVLLGLLALYAACAAIEAALFHMRPLDRRRLRDAGLGSVEWLLQRPRRTLATLLIAQEMTGALFTGVIWVWVSSRPGALAASVAVSALVAALALMALGDVAPKAIGSRAARPIAATMAPVVRLLYLVLTPLRRFAIGTSDLVLGLQANHSVPHRGRYQEDQLRALLDQGRDSGALAAHERQVIDRVFEFGDLTVGRLMTPRPDMFTVGLDTPWPALVARLRDGGYSRVPVWEGSPDNIIGVLLLKSVLPLLPQSGSSDPPGPRRLRTMLRPPHFVPPNRKADEMLAIFRTQRFHMAFVVDEYGSVVGLVTLDDLLQELVGELLDETDVEETTVFTGPDGHERVRGTMDIEDFAARFHVEPPTGDFNSVGGFAIASLGELPELGDAVEWQGLRLVVERIDGRRVGQLRVERLIPAREIEGDAP